MMVVMSVSFFDFIFFVPGPFNLGSPCFDIGCLLGVKTHSF